MEESDARAWRPQCAQRWKWWKVMQSVMFHTDPDVNDVEHLPTISVEYGFFGTPDSSAHGPSHPCRRRSWVSQSPEMVQRQETSMKTRWLQRYLKPESSWVHSWPRTHFPEHFHFFPIIFLSLSFIFSSFSYHFFSFTFFQSTFFFRSLLFFFLNFFFVPCITTKMSSFVIFSIIFLNLFLDSIFRICSAVMFCLILQCCPQ